MRKKTLANIAGFCTLASCIGGAITTGHYIAKSFEERDMERAIFLEKQDISVRSKYNPLFFSLAFGAAIGIFSGILAGSYVVEKIDPENRDFPWITGTDGMW